MDARPIGFLTLPRELRDQIYGHWSKEEEYRHQKDEGAWIPFEGSDKPAQYIRINAWRINSILDKNFSHGLLLNHQIALEFLSTAFKGLHLLLNIEHLAINETLAPWTLESWTIPALVLENARELDIRIELIPRTSFALRHTIEAQMKLLRDLGYNSYMGEPRNSQHRTLMNMRRVQTIGKNHIEWRTPESAFQNFDAAMRPLAEAVAERGLRMPEATRDEFDSDRHLQRYLFWEMMGAGKNSAMMNRFWQRVEAIKKVWFVDLPWGDYLRWFKEDVYARDGEMAEMLERVLWDDFMVGMRRLVEQLMVLCEAAKNLRALRVHLRVEDEAIAGVRCALWELLEEVPAFMELKGLESISLFSNGNLFNGEYMTNVEQWTSNSVGESGGLRNAIGKSGEPEQDLVNIRIKSGRLVRT